MWGISDGDGEKLLIHLAAYPPVHDRHVPRELSQNSSKYFKLSPIISKIRNVFILVPSNLSYSDDFWLKKTVCQAVRAEKELWAALEIQRIWRGCATGNGRVVSGQGGCWGDTLGMTVDIHGIYMVDNG